MMKLSASLVVLLAAPAAAFQVGYLSTTASYLDSLSAPQTSVLPETAPELPAVPAVEEAVAEPLPFSLSAQEPLESAPAEKEGLPMIRQEPVLHALHDLEDNMERIHEENMEALLGISSSFKKLVIRTKSEEMEEQRAQQEAGEQYTIKQEVQEPALPATFIGSGWR